MMRKYKFIFEHHIDTNDVRKYRIEVAHAYNVGCIIRYDKICLEFGFRSDKFGIKSKSVFPITS